MALVARTSTGNSPYTLEEDALIVAIFDRNEKTSVSEVKGIFDGAGYDRSVNSLRYRLGKLGEDEINGYGDLHKNVTDDEIKAAEDKAAKVMASIAKK